MSLCLMQVLHQELSLRDDEEACDSFFVRVEKALNNQHYETALHKALSRKNVYRYRSVMDAFFCELFPIWKRSCFRYYDDKGPKLKDVLNKQQIKKYESAMLAALVVARLLYDDKTNFSWKFFLEETEHRCKEIWPY